MPRLCFTKFALVLLKNLSRYGDSENPYSQVIEVPPIFKFDFLICKTLCLSYSEIKVILINPSLSSLSQRKKDAFKLDILALVSNPRIATYCQFLGF